MAVHLDRRPHSAFLVAWGRAYEGWWACVTFRVAVHTPSGSDGFAVAAWVPAASVTRPSWTAPEDVPRLWLGERKSWPAPPGWPSWYVGAWVSGDVPLPAGVEAVRGAAWRNKPARGPREWR